MIAPQSRSVEHRLDARVRGQRTPLSVLSFLCVSILLSFRILTQAVVAGQPELDNAGLVDFRDAIYYPALAFLEGNNPYDAPSYAQTYPVGQLFPPYSPVTLVLYLPLALFGLETAGVIFYVVNLALTPVLAWLALRFCGLKAAVAQTFFLATLILLSRGGYLSLFWGQCTTYVVIGVYAALHLARRRPWVAGCGLAVAALKPTFGVPLAALMLARGDARPVVIGMALAVASALPPTTVLVHNAGGVGAFVASLGESHKGFKADPGVNTASSPSRVDTPALIGRLFDSPLRTGAEFGISLIVLVLGSVAVRRLARGEDDATRLASASLICLSTIACVYHQTTDLPLLTVPLVALFATALIPRANAGALQRWSLFALLALPMVNHIMAPSVLQFLGVSSSPAINSSSFRALASLNGAAIFIAFCLSVACALRDLSPVPTPQRRSS